MTNEELRIAIATAKGYSVVEKRNIENRAYYRLLHDGKVVDLWAASASEVEAWRFAPNYPEDIAAAMELWDEMKCDITVWFDEVLDVWVAYDKKRDAYHDEEMLTLAISKCWLAWKGAK